MKQMRSIEGTLFTNLNRQYSENKFYLQALRIQIYKYQCKIHNLPEMTQYATLLEELQSHKRELTSLRKKCITLESDNTILRDSEHAIKLALQTLKQTAARLERNNESLQKQNQRLTKQYECQFLSLKSEIDRKQDNMRELQIAMQNNVINMSLVRRQVQCQVQARFIQQIGKKDNKFNQLQAKFDVLKREKEVDKEKWDIQVRSLQSALQQSESRHLQQVKEYANKLYQQSQKKILYSQDSMLKRLRRQLDCVRNMLNEKEQQIQTLMGQKSQLLQQNTIITSCQQKSNQQLLTQLTNYKRSMEQHKNQQSLQQTRQQNTQVRALQRELKKTKQQIYNLKQQLKQKQQKIEGLKTKSKQIQLQCQSIQIKDRKKYQLKIQELQQNNRHLGQNIRQLENQQQYYKNKYNAIISTTNNNRQQYQQNNTNNRNIHQHTTYNTDKNTQNTQNKQNRHNREDRTDMEDNINDKKIKNVSTRQDQQIRNKNRRQEENIENSQRNVVKKYITNEENIIEEKNIKNIKKIYNQINDDQQNTNTNTKNVRDIRQQHHQNIKRINGQQQLDHHDSPIDNYKIQKQRDKVRQLGRKYIELQNKYNKCKKKLDQANQKVLQLIRNKIAMVSPPKTINQGININSHGRTDPQAYSNFKNGQKKQINKQDKNKLKQMISSAGQHFYRSTSPKHNKFYQKSLSFKSKSKTKDLRCINHDHEEAENDCQHQHPHKH